MSWMHKAKLVGLAICCFGSPASSQDGLSSDDLAITAIYCESAENTERSVLLFGREGDDVFTLPDRRPVTMVANVMSFASGDGLFSLTADKFQFLSDDVAVSGLCHDFSDDLAVTLNDISAQYPDALRASAAYLMASAEIAAAKTEASETRLDAYSKITAAKAEAEKIRADWELAKVGLAEATEAANDQVQLKLSAEISKLADGDKTNAKELANMRARFENEQRMNEKLKLRICELDPSATFSVCK